MATPRPPRRRAAASGPLPVPPAPPSSLPAPVKQSVACPPPSLAKRSYAQAAAAPPASSEAPPSKAESLVYLTRAFPSLPANRILELHRQASGTPRKGSRSPGCTTSSPSRRSVIIRIRDFKVQFDPLASALS